jgi:hypothetical protein
VGRTLYELTKRTAKASELARLDAPARRFMRAGIERTVPVAGVQKPHYPIATRTALAAHSIRLI